MKPQPLQKRQDFIRGRREKRKLARSARTRRQVLRYTMLFLMVGAGACGFTHLPWAIDDLHDDIWIHGNRVVSEVQVRKSIASVLHKPLYNVDPQKLSAEIRKLPAVSHAFVRRSILPKPHLRVEIMEEFPWATYSSTPDGAPEGVIAQTGRYIPLQQFPSVVQPPLRLCGGKALKLSADEIAQWDSWVRMIEVQTGQPVMLVNMTSPTQVQAISGGLQLQLGAVDSGFQRRIGRLSSVMPVVANLSEQLQYIDLSLDSNIPLKLDKSARGKQVSPFADPAAGANGASPLPTDRSAQSSTAPGEVATKSAPLF